MAQSVTHEESVTYSAEAKTVDVAGMQTAIIEAIDGGGGGDGNNASGGNGGSVSNVTVDLGFVNSSVSSLKVQANNGRTGRISAPDTSLANTGDGAGSSEVWLPSDPSQSAPLAGAGGGAGGPGDDYTGDSQPGSPGARFSDDPLGGDATTSEGKPGKGYIDKRRRVYGGSTTTGGGKTNNSSPTSGTITITYRSTQPQPPSGLTVTQRDSGVVTLSWSPSDNTTGYRVYRATSSGTTVSDYTQIGEVSTTTYTDTGPTDGEKYFYRVTGYAESQESTVNATEVSAIAPLTAPPAPTVTSGSGLNVVSWQSVNDTALGSVTLERSTDGGSSWSSVASGISPTTTTYDDTNVTSGTTYQYRLKRITSHTSVTSRPSDPMEYIGAPDGLSVSVSGSDLQVSWNSISAATGYRVYRTTGPASDPIGDYTHIASVTTTDYTDTSVSAGTEYHYRVTAYKD